MTAAAHLAFGPKHGDDIQWPSTASTTALCCGVELSNNPHLESSCSSSATWLFNALASVNLRVWCFILRNDCR